MNFLIKIKSSRQNLNWALFSEIFPIRKKGRKTVYNSVELHVAGRNVCASDSLCRLYVNLIEIYRLHKLTSTQH